MLHDPAALIQLGLGAALMLTTTTALNRLSAWRAGRHAEAREAAAAFVPAAPEPPRPSVLDGAEVPPPPRLAAMIAAREAAPRVIAPVRAAEQLIAFMQRYGGTGWHTIDEIDDYWRWLCDTEGLDAIQPSIVRAELAAMPQVIVRRPRLNGPEYRAVRARTGLDRATVYRIPLPEVAIAKPGGQIVAGHETAKARPARTKTAQRPATSRAPGAPSVRPSADAAETTRHRTIADVRRAA